MHHKVLKFNNYNYIARDERLGNKATMMRNREIANKLLDHVTKRFPLGGVNRLDNRTIAENHIIQQMELLERKLTLFDFFGTSSIFPKPPPSLRGGSCDLLAMYAVQDYLHTAHPPPFVEYVSFDCHAVVVIGRKYHSNIYDMDTWGNDAVILDPWAKKIYIHATKNMLQAQDRIPFFLNGEIVNQHHYSGQPKIATCNTCILYTHFAKPVYAHQLQVTYQQQICVKYQTKDDVSLALRRAVCMNQLDDVMFLVMYCPIDLASTSSNGKTAKDLAAAKGYKKIVAFLEAQEASFPNLSSRAM